MTEMVGNSIDGICLNRQCQMAKNGMHMALAQALHGGT